MVILGIIVLLLGVAFIYQPTMEWFIRASNEARGVKSEITPLTILSFRALGIICIVAAVLLVLKIINF